LPCRMIFFSAGLFLCKNICYFYPTLKKSKFIF
jgi:hypothetical protein